MKKSTKIIYGFLVIAVFVVNLPVAQPFLSAVSRGVESAVRSTSEAVQKVVKGALSDVEPQLARAQTTASSPTINIQFGDDGDVTPELPYDCQPPNGVTSTPGTSTTDNSDPDCLRVKIVNPQDTVYTDDFRFCLQINGRTACTGWASEIGTVESSSPFTKASSNGNLSGTMLAYTDTRPISSTNLPSGTTFTNVIVGVALAYQRDDGPCLGSSGFRYANGDDGWSDPWSGWAYGAQEDNDPGCFRSALRIGTVNAPPDAEYVSTTIPSVLSASSTHNGNYTITMRNKGMPWPILADPDSKVRGLDGHCDEANFNYAADGSNSCTDYIIYSSQRFRLQRLDYSSDPGLTGVVTRQIRPNSNDVTFVNGAFAYSQPEVLITDVNNQANVNTSNTLPFLIKQDITYRRVTGTNEVCVPPGGDGPVDDDIPTDQITKASGQSKFSNLLNKLGLIKTVQAYAGGDGGIEDCESFPYDYISQSYNPPVNEITAGQTTVFVPINIITSTSLGSTTLRFRMVDLQNLSNYSNGYDGGLFGTEAQITITAQVRPWTISCPSYYAIEQGQNVQFTLYAFPNAGYTNPISVTMISTPPGATMTPSPLVLTPSNNNQGINVSTGIALVSTAGLSPGTYILNFNFKDGPNGEACLSNFVVNAAPIEVNLKFDDQDGPTYPTPTTGSSGVLSWTTINASSCNASMQSGADTSTPTSWTGVKDFDNDGSNRYFNVSGMVLNSTYIFKITCQNSFGGTQSDTVQVSVTSSPQPPTAKLYCTSASQPVENDDDCAVDPGGPIAMLTWTSSMTKSINGASACTITDDNSSLPDLGGVIENEPVGQSVGPFSPPPPTSIVFTLKCTGYQGTSDAVDTVTITVNNLQPAPVNLSSSNNPCGVVTLNWTTNSPVATSGYRVYHSTTSTGGPWTEITDGSSRPLPPTTTSFVHDSTDSPPLATLNNYYKVEGYSGPSESDDVVNQNISGPININPCDLGIESSDKDILFVDTSGGVDYTNSSQLCSTKHEPITENRIFLAGDIVTYRINVCNDGDFPFTNVSVEDTMSNLTIISNSIQYFPPSCVKAPAVISGASVTFSFDDIPAPILPEDPPVIACAVEFKATITAPVGGVSVQDRFHNRADIFASGTTFSLETTAYPFVVNSSVPNRVEKPPQ